MRFNRILTLVKTNLILRRNRHNYKIIERNKRKSIETRECGDENIDATIAVCGDVWSFIWNSWSDVWTFIPSTSIRNDGFLILDDFSFASIASYLQCLYESKDLNRICLMPLRN